MATWFHRDLRSFSIIVVPMYTSVYSYTFFFFLLSTWSPPNHFGSIASECRRPPASPRERLERIPRCITWSSSGSSMICFFFPSASNQPPTSKRFASAYHTKRFIYFCFLRIMPSGRYLCTLGVLVYV